MALQRGCGQVTPRTLPSAIRPVQYWARQGSQCTCSQSLSCMHLAPSTGARHTPQSRTLSANRRCLWAASWSRMTDSRVWEEEGARGGGAGAAAAAGGVEKEEQGRPQASGRWAAAPRELPSDFEVLWFKAGTPSVLSELRGAV